MKMLGKKEDLEHSEVRFFIFGIKFTFSFGFILFFPQGKTVIRFRGKSKVCCDTAFLV